jgi:Four helix bundle sensory module for signal transduction
MERCAMKPSTLISLLVGCALVAGLFWAVMRNPRTPSEQLVQQARRVEIVSRMRGELAAESEAEKSAVMAVTDHDSQLFADQALARLAEVERDRVELEKLLLPGRERDLLATFSKEFVELQHVDAELLELAVKNTNLKASALAFGPAANAMREMDHALSELITESAAGNAPNAKKVMMLASAAQSAALRIEVLLAPHIAEENDAKMDALEAAMGAEAKAVDEDLKALHAMLPSSEELGEAAVAWKKLGELRKEILKLSRENTNVRSLSISLNQKRKLMLACDETLTALEKAVAQETNAQPPSRPR